MSMAERRRPSLGGQTARARDAIWKAVGICSGIHLSRYYLTPMMEKGLIKRTDPDHPQSPQQRYRLA